jgi:alkylation response protein AidB-like acyl-CoA dehydrogenase
MDPTRKIARIDFRGAHAKLLGNLNDVAEPILRTLDRAAIALANEMVGGAQTMLDSAVSYAKLRVQFGRTIGSFQAIKHKLADMPRRRTRACGLVFDGAAAPNRYDVGFRCTLVEMESLRSV